MREATRSAAAVVVVACALVASAAAASGAKEGAVKTAAVNEQDARPAIDRAAPAKTERAVFALG
jgi:hypothetical protein